jgi:type II secretory pathway component PulF
MPRFTFEGIDRVHVKTHGEVEAETKEAAVKKVRAMGYFPMKVVEQALTEGRGASSIGKGARRVESESAGGVPEETCMRKFTFEGINRFHEKTHGEVDADTREAAIEKVRSMGYFPTKLVEKGPGPTADNKFEGGKMLGNE